ncbi:MAG: histidine ammonia-lyase [Thermoplasmata archaeon]|nr:histidine ammonia-lyase [Thermoplasmata archaeon]MCI4340903.1 histidine ammonia-lyase [Thermoplasmata archaeon]
MTESLPVDGSSLTLESFLAVVRGRCAVEPTAEALAAVREGRAAVERAVAAGRPVYGVTTGFGALAGTAVAPARAQELQLNLVRSHAAGTGPALPAELVRGLLLLRLNSLCRGLSGVRPELPRLLADCLNQGILPLVPEQGSVGASGDLAPLAHLALALIGEGSCVDRQGGIQPSREALEAAGLHPLQLAEKEGVALVNGTALMTSYLALGVADGRELLSACESAAAMAYDALGGSLEPLDDRMQAARGLAEQRRVAERMRERLAGSGLTSPVGAVHPQDPYTLRALPQVLGAVELALGWAEGLLATELNAVSDNPIVLPGDQFLSGANFHGQPLALALDTLAIGVQYVAGFSERRTARLLHPGLNGGLPAFLSPEPGTHSGYMIGQYLASALVVENAGLLHPASAFSLPTSADQEDYNSEGAWAGAKLRRILENSRRVVAVEWLVAGRALELRRPKTGGRGSEAALRALRGLVPALDRDRPLAPDIERVAGAIADGTLLRRVRAQH